jgi:NAD(P)-dependent dehydrogenase (short-subunit alcohol dehydrogenase family)
MTGDGGPPAYIVTGANSGIGKAIAKGLAERGLPVVLVCRDPLKGHAALDEIRVQTGSTALSLVIGDLSSCAGVHKVAEHLLEEVPRIGALINNAGLWNIKRELNADGLETTFFVNHLAPFLLTHLLLERLKESAPSRVVNVNAGLYIFGRVDLERTPTGEDMHWLRTYANSKLCGVYFTCALARRLKATRVTVNAIHPGVIRTNLGNGGGIGGVCLRFAKKLWKSPEKGAQGPIYLAISDEVKDKTGCFYFLLKEKPIATVALDDVFSAKLWTLSESLTGLR